MSDTPPHVFKHADKFYVLQQRAEPPQGILNLQAWRARRFDQSPGKEFSDVSIQTIVGDTRNPSIRLPEVAGGEEVTIYVSIEPDTRKNPLAPFARYCQQSPRADILFPADIAMAVLKPYEAARQIVENLQNEIRTQAETVRLTVKVQPLSGEKGRKLSPARSSRPLAFELRGKLYALRSSKDYIGNVRHLDAARLDVFDQWERRFEKVRLEDLFSASIEVTPVEEANAPAVSVFAARGREARKALGVIGRLAQNQGYASHILADQETDEPYLLLCPYDAPLPVRQWLAGQVRAFFAPQSAEVTLVGGASLDKQKAGAPGAPAAQIAPAALPSPVASPAAPEAAIPRPPAFKVHGEYYALRAVNDLPGTPIQVCQTERFAGEPEGVEMLSTPEFRSRVFAYGEKSFTPPPGGQPFIVYAAQEAQEASFERLLKESDKSVLDGVKTGGARPYLLILFDRTKTAEVEDAVRRLLAPPAAEAPAQPSAGEEAAPKAEQPAAGEVSVAALAAAQSIALPVDRASAASALAAEPAESASAETPAGEIMPQGGGSPAGEVSVDAPIEPQPDAADAAQGVASPIDQAPTVGGAVAVPAEQASAETPTGEPILQGGQPPAAEERAAAPVEAATPVESPASQETGAQGGQHPVTQGQAATPAVQGSTAPAGPRLALRLGGQTYALIEPYTTGSTAMVWRTRLLPAGFDLASYNILSPSAETRQQLIGKGQQMGAAGQSFSDPGRGDEAAIKIAYPKRENEEALKSELRALQRLKVIRLYYPESGMETPDFPCLAMEWVKGRKLSESQAFIEKDGLEVCARLAAFLQQARGYAPDIIPTDSLKADGVFIEGGSGSFQARLVDWNVYTSNEGNILEKTLIRFGEVMTRIFAPGLNFSVNRQTDTAPLEELAAGAPDDIGVQQWDALTYGTRDLIRRVLLREGFEGGASAVLTALARSIEEQRERWAEANPARRARLESGAARLAWLEIAAKGDRLLPQDKADYEGKLLRGALAELDRSGRYSSALVLLRTAARSYADAYFRWSLLAHELARLVAEPEGFKNYRLGETLTAFEAGSYAAAAADLERAEGLLRKKGRLTEAVRRPLVALRLRARILAGVDAAIEDLETTLRLDRARESSKLIGEWRVEAQRCEGGLLPVAEKLEENDADSACVEAVSRLEEAIREFEKKNDAYVDLLSKEELEAARQDMERYSRLARCRALLQLADDLAAVKDDFASWEAALAYYDRVAAAYPDLWRASPRPSVPLSPGLPDEAPQGSPVANPETPVAYEQRRQAVKQRLAGHFFDQAVAEARKEDFDLARATQDVTHALYYRPGNPDALRLLSGLSAVQRGYLEFELAASDPQRYERAKAEFETALAAVGGADVYQGVAWQMRLLERFSQQRLELAEIKEQLEQGVLDALLAAIREASDARTWDDPRLPAPWRERLQDHVRALDLPLAKALKRLPGSIEDWLKEQPPLEKITSLLEQICAHPEWKLEAVEEKLQEEIWVCQLRQARRDHDYDRMLRIVASLKEDRPPQGDQDTPKTQEEPS